MNELLTLVVNAHGGLEQWRRFNKVAVHMLVGGVLWKVKGQEGVLDDSQIEVELHKQHGRYIDFGKKSRQETYFSPQRVAILDNGHNVRELINPRHSFSDHKLETPWNRLQLVYFGTYAMWEYLTIPFNLILPGVRTEELTPWNQGEDTWRRLHVCLPESWAYHSREQVFYFDKNGLLKRMDYNVEISGNIGAVQYVSNYRDVQGIKLPTRRLVFRRGADGRPICKPVIVDIELLEIKFQ